MKPGIFLIAFALAILSGCISQEKYEYTVSAHASGIYYSCSFSDDFSGPVRIEMKSRSPFVFGLLDSRKMSINPIEGTSPRMVQIQGYEASGEGEAAYVLEGDVSNSQYYSLDILNNSNAVKIISNRRLVC
ncbi:MAG: hypothetical protein WC263_04780 [Candidatus Micrarchaeia archaeon]|jgi:hypothetical protein